MAHSARDILQEEMGKLNRWQVSLADKSGAVYKQVKQFEKDIDLVMEALGNQTGAGEGLFTEWESVNDAIAGGKEPDEQTLKKIRIFIQISGGRGTGEGPMSEKGYHTKGSDGLEVTRSLENWVNLKSGVLDDSFNGAFLKQLDLHKLPNWLEDLYELITENDYENDLVLMKKSLEAMTEMTKDFEEKSKKFFADVPEGQDKLFVKGDQKSESAFARRLLGVGGKENDGAISMSSLRNDSRKAISDTLSYQRQVLKMLQTALSMVNDVCDMGSHFAKILHQVAVAAAKDLKASGKEVPDDLQEAINALSPKALKG